MKRFHAQPPGGGGSYWQPLPARGYIVVAASPREVPGLPFSTGLQAVSPGGSVRPHAHEAQFEVITILEGSGTAEVEDERIPLLPGTTLAFAPGTRHAFTNDGAGELRFTWTISPPGLEDFFAEIGRPRLPGEEMPEPFTRPEGPAVDSRHAMHITS
jgi:quercetin dioxygenase-like cupin family protein